MVGIAKDETWWREQARCHGEDTEIFLQQSHRYDEVKAKQLCNDCAVRLACLDSALKEKERNAVRGGHNSNELMALIRSKVIIDVPNRPVPTAPLALEKETDMKDTERREHLKAAIDAELAAGRDGLVLDNAGTTKLVAKLHFIRRPKLGSPTAQLHTFLDKEDRDGRLLRERRSDKYYWLLAYELPQQPKPTLFDEMKVVTVVQGVPKRPDLVIRDPSHNPSNMHLHRRPNVHEPKVFKEPRPASASTRVATTGALAQPKRRRAHDTYRFIAAELSRLGGVGGPEINAGYFASMLGAERSGINQCLLSMHKEGYINRKVNGRRPISITLLDAGYDLLRSRPAQPQPAEPVSRSLDALPAPVPVVAEEPVVADVPEAELAEVAKPQVENTATDLTDGQPFDYGQVATQLLEQATAAIVGRRQLEQALAVATCERDELRDQLAAERTRSTELERQRGQLQTELAAAHNQLAAYRLAHPVSYLPSASAQQTVDEVGRQEASA